jgi:hypothetical protein
VAGAGGSQGCRDLLEALSGFADGEVRHRAEKFVASVANEHVVAADVCANGLADQPKQRVALDVIAGTVITGTSATRVGPAVQPKHDWLRRSGIGITDVEQAGVDLVDRQNGGLVSAPAARGVIVLVTSLRHHEELSFRQRRRSTQ